jgi:hypothetical protein
MKGSYEKEETTGDSFDKSNLLQPCIQACVESWNRQLYQQQY